MFKYVAVDNENKIKLCFSRNWKVNLADKQLPCFLDFCLSTAISKAILNLYI